MIARWLTWRNRKGIVGAFVSLICLAPTIHAEQQPQITPKQFLELYRASMQSVASLSLVWRSSSMEKCVDGGQWRDPFATAIIVEKIKGNQRYVNDRRTQNGVLNETTYACNAKYEKLLVDGKGRPRPKGIVDARHLENGLSERIVTNQNSMELVYDPFHALSMIELESAQVVADDVSGLYALAVKVQSLTWVVVVDPSKGFIPIAHAWCAAPTRKRWDAKTKTSVPVGKGMTVDLSNPVDRLLKRPGVGIVGTSRNSDFREFDGISFPARIDFVTTNTRTLMIADAIDVNIPLPDEAFDIVFPNGTVVEDRIANIFYLVETVEGTTPPATAVILPENSVLSREMLPPRLAAQDADLEKTFRRAEEMTGTQEPSLRRRKRFVIGLALALVCLSLVGGIAYAWARKRAHT